MDWKEVVNIIHNVMDLCLPHTGWWLMTVRHRLVFVAQDILISHLRLMVFQLVPYFPDILCVFGGIVFRCVHSKIDIWIRLSNGFPFRPVHTTIDYVKSNGGNFRAIFRSFSFFDSKNITNQITDWIGFVNRSPVRICGETQKWISKMREKKREKKGDTMVDLW